MSPCDKSKFRDYVVLCPRASFRDAIPLALRLPRRCAPRNDTESGRFFSKRMFCAICGHFLRSVAAHRLSNVSFRKSFRFLVKPTDFVIARRAFSMPDAASFGRMRRHPGTNYAGGRGSGRWLHHDKQKKPPFRRNSGYSGGAAQI